MIDTTKKQLIEFICAAFKTSEGEDVTPSGLDGYKKDELVQFIIDRELESEFESYINSLS